MYDLPPDLPRLRTLRTWHALWVDRLDEAIAAAERRERERDQGEQHRPAPPDWLLQVGIGAGAPPVAVHVGGCAVSGKRLRPLGRDQAIRALTEGVTACTLCRPDTELGVLE